MTPALVKRRIDAIQIPTAGTTARGVVELATDAETQAGTDTERAVTPAGLTSVIETLGAMLPPGTLLDFAGDAAPDGFLLCNGQSISRTDYAGLFAAIGTTWGTGDGSTTFNVPDLRRRVTIGSGGTQVAGPETGVGDTGGAEQLTLTTDQLPSHSHSQSSHTHSIGSHTHSQSSHTHSIGSHTHRGPSHTHSIGSHTHSQSSHAHSIGSHTHRGPSHTHSIGSHSHTQPSHTHSGPAHTHTVEYRDESGGGRSYGFDMAYGPSEFSSGSARTLSGGGGTTGSGGNQNTGSTSLTTNAGGTGNTGSASGTTGSGGTGSTGSRSLTTNAGGTGNTGSASGTTGSGGTGNTGSTSLTTDTGGTEDTGSAGSGQAVALMQPSAVVLKIIKF